MGRRAGAARLTAAGVLGRCLGRGTSAPSHSGTTPQGNALRVAFRPHEVAPPTLATCKTIAYTVELGRIFAAELRCIPFF